MGLLSLTLFFLSFLIGYTFPQKALYFSIITFTLFYPVNLTIVPSQLIFLNINRVVFAMVVGIHLKYGKKLQLKLILKNKWVKIFIIFCLYVALISLSDRAINIFFAFIPYRYTALVLGFLIIRSEKDFKWVTKVMAWEAGFFSLVVLLEFFHIIDLMLILRKLQPSFNVDMIQEGFRGLVFRVPGWDGHPIFSAARLVVLFPLTLLNLKWSKNKILNFSFPVLSFASIVLLMSRSPYLAFALSSMFIYFYVAIKIKKKLLNQFIFFIRNLLIGAVVLTLIIFYVPVLRRTVTNMYYYSTSAQTARDTDIRFERIPYAMAQFRKNPIIGYGSPQYVYFKIMNTQDIPSTITYLLAGGIPLFILFMAWVLWMPYYFFRYFKMQHLTNDDKIIIIYISGSFVGGIVPMFINNIQNSLFLMLILFTATYKYFLIKRNTYSESLEKQITSIKD